MSKKLAFLLSEELRLGYDPGHDYSLLSEAGIKYKLTKQLDVAANLRVTVKPDEVAYRPFADISYQFEINKWSFEPRLRYQHQIEQHELAKNYFRLKSTVSYAVKKGWGPFVSGEVFYHAFYNEGSEFDEYRISAGIEYQYKKVHTLKLYYLYDQEFNVNNAVLKQALGVSYEYEF